MPWIKLQPELSGRRGLSYASFLTHHAEKPAKQETLVLHFTCTVTWGVPSSFFLFSKSLSPFQILTCCSLNTARVTRESSDQHRFVSSVQSQMTAWQPPTFINPADTGSPFTRVWGLIKPVLAAETALGFVLCVEKVLFLVHLRWWERRSRAEKLHRDSDGLFHLLM